MKILALDSTAVTASASICEDEKPVAEFTVTTGNTHSETLLPMIEDLFKASKLTIDDIGMIAFSEGPGSFTGVRIGCATVKGLAFGRDLPVVGVSTLEALAYNLVGFDGIICPVMNARRSQVYNALFRCGGGKFERLCPDRAIAVSELEAELKQYGEEQIYLVGDGYDLVKEEFRNVDTENTPRALRLQSAYSVAVCGLKKYRDGNSGTDRSAAPVYLRLSQAERERIEKGIQM